MAYLEIKNVIKKFDNFTAVNNISLEADQGDFITLLGPSGCGKTTLLKCIGGFHEVDQGTLHLDGEQINTLPPEQRDTVMCFQSYALFPHLTVSKNVSFGLEQKKVPKDEIYARVKEALDLVDIGEQADKLPSQLSGGQQQRVALARAMVMRPKLILFDEPLSNLDAKLREKVRFQIKELQRQIKFTAIYVTHDQSEALALSDKIFVLNKGQIQQEGKPREIYNLPNNRFVADFIGTANIMPAEVISQQGNSYELKTPLGTLTALSEKAPVDKKIYIGWRPESIQTNSLETDNHVDALVEQSAFLGNCTHIMAHDASLKSCHFNLEITEDMPLPLDSTIRFRIPPQKIFFLEKQEIVQ